MEVANKHKELSEFERHYKELHPLYEKFGSRLHILIEELISKASIPVDHIEYRVKTVESFIKKIKTKGYYADPFEQIKDFVGIRVITYYHDSVNTVTELIRKQFNVDDAHSGDKIQELEKDEFGYRSVHLVISLSEDRAKLDEWQHFAGLPAEIQIRSVLQHAWAVLSQDMYYKNPNKLPTELQRRIFRLSAQLESADEEFTALRNMLASMAKEEEISTPSERDLSLNLDGSSVKFVGMIFAYT